MANVPSSADGAEARPPRGGGEAPPGAAPRPAMAAVLVLLVVFAAQGLPALFGGLATMFSHGDMVRFHLPQINYFITHPLTVLDYPPTGATMPGHHLLLAWFARGLGHEIVTETTWSVRLLNWGLAAAFVTAAWAICTRLSGRPWRALALALPLAASPYVLGSAIWITTDDTALLHYSLLLAALLFRPHQPALAAVAAVLLVYWRQIYLPVAAAATLFSTSADPARSRGQWPWRLLASVPALLVVAVYVRHWDGFTPRIAQLYNQLTFNPAVPLHALALTGLFTIPYIPFLWPAARAVDRRRVLQGAGVAALLVLALWLAGPSTWDTDAGRWGSIVWVLARRTPAIAGRSPLLLLLAAAGGAALAVLALHARQTRERPVELGMLILCFLGISSQVFAWQRYVEPVVLLTFAVAAARQPLVHRLAFVGPLLLAAGLAAMAQARIWGLVGRLLG